MTSDLSPEASPFRPFDETTWAVDFAHAVEQRELDIVRKLVREDEEVEFLQAKEEFDLLSDDDLGPMLADEFQDETALVEILADLAGSGDVEGQFRMLTPLGARKKAGLFVVTKRLVAVQEQPK